MSNTSQNTTAVGSAVNGSKNVVEFLNMPFYTYDGSYTPIAVNADQNVNYHLADGTITYLKVGV